MELSQLETLNWARIWSQKFHRRVDSLVALPFLPFSQKILFLFGPISPLGLVWEIGVTVISILAISLWIVEQTDSYQPLNGNLWIFFAIFLADLLLQFFRVSTFRSFGRFLFNLTTIAELINIVALAVGTNLNFLRVFRLLATFETYDGLRYRKPFSYISPILLSIAKVVYLFFCFYFSVTCGYWMIEKGASVTRFKECFYFVVVTVSTSGYGDITPKTELGRAFVTTFLFLLIFGLPYQVGVLISLASQKHSATTGTPLATRTFPWCTSHHAVICGYVTVESLASIFRNFFHVHHSIKRPRLVIVPNSTPDPTLISMITTSDFYRNRVTYIEGSILAPQVLHQATLRTAFGVLVLPPDDGIAKSTSNEPLEISEQLDIEIDQDHHVLLSML